MLWNISFACKIRRLRWLQWKRFRSLPGRLRSSSRSADDFAHRLERRPSILWSLELLRNSVLHSPFFMVLYLLGRSSTVKTLGRCVVQSLCVAKDSTHAWFQLFRQKHLEIAETIYRYIYRYMVSGNSDHLYQRPYTEGRASGPVGDQSRTRETKPHFHARLCERKAAGVNVSITLRGAAVIVSDNVLLWPHYTQYMVSVCIHG